MSESTVKASKKLKKTKSKSSSKNVEMDVEFVTAQPQSMSNELNSDEEQEEADEPVEGLHDVPLGELLKLRGRVHDKLFQKAVFGEHSVRSTAKKTKIQKREHKRRPREISSRQRPPKIPLPIFEESKAKAHQKYDPRFDDRCGEFDEFIYDQSYSFMKDLRNEEKSILKKVVRSVEDKEKKAEIKATVKRIEDQERSDAQKREKREQMKKIRKMNEERMKEGKAPVFLKKADLKRMAAEEKFNRLSESGKLNSYIRKKEIKTGKKLKARESQPKIRRED